MAEYGGMYTKQTMMVLCSVTASACMMIFKVTGLWGFPLLTIIKKHYHKLYPWMGYQNYINRYGF